MAWDASVSSDNSSRIFRFGVFEVDLKAGDLRRSGLKVKLQEQPLLVLAALLERPGEIVTREELSSKLWPADTFVDFDHSLNAAIKRLRDALGESAESPIFIETLARRGYRFIAPVVQDAASQSEAHQREPTSSSVLAGTPTSLAIAASVCIAGAVLAIFASLLRKDFTPDCSSPRTDHDKCCRNPDQWLSDIAGWKISRVF